MKRRKPIVMALSVLLVLGMVLTSVAPAYAASSQTVYVITSVKQNGTKMNTFSYDGYGRLKKASLMKGMQKCEFTYNSKNQLTKFRRSFNDWCNFDYTYNSKGQISKIKNYYTLTSNNKYAYDGLNSKLSYSNKGKVYKEVVKEGKKTYTNKYKYNSKGLLTKAVIKHPQRKGTYKYTYDKKKNVQKVALTGTDWDETRIYTNKYNSSGRLTKQIITSVSGEDENKITYTYTYKKIKVSSKYAAMVKAQQWALINEGLNSPLNLNFSIPRNDYNGM